MAGLSQENLFRDVFSVKTITDLAARICAVYPEFDSDGFTRDALDRLETLGFLERSHHITDQLRAYLPDEYQDAIRILLAALGPELESPGETVWEAFIVMPQTAYVSRYGTDDFDLSMHALYEMTKRLTAEGDLRTFIELDFERAMGYLRRWVNDSSPHVRRLVSEGTRPRLPLAGRIRRFQDDPQPVIALLDQLKSDPSLYVRRSVANNINDIAKDNPEVAIRTLERWHSDGDANVRWVVRHAARTLVKQGHPAIFAILGYEPEPQVEIDRLAIAPDPVTVGDEATLRCRIRSTADREQALVLDYVVHYVKANGARREKVFKLRNVRLPAGASLSIEKKQRFADTSGRKHYPGVHLLELQLNGRRLGRAEFRVTAIQE